MGSKEQQADYFLQAALLHGPVLVNKAHSEHQDDQGRCVRFLAQNHDTQGQGSYYFWQRLQACKSKDPKSMQLSLLGTTLDEDFEDRICSFISSKSDLLFSGKRREESRMGNECENETVYQDLYGDIPPLEMFLGIPAPVERCQLLKGISEDVNKTKLRYNYYEDESYLDHLSSHPSLKNPKTLNTLIAMLGIDSKKQSSLLRGFQGINYPAGDYCDELRRQQSVKWSMGSTAKGIEYFKADEMRMALKYLDHALQIDGHNIEALVAKGALLANEGKYSMAVPLFRQALSINQKHKNAMKYLVETLTEQAIQQEKSNDLSNAQQCLHEALRLKPDNSTASDHLARVKLLLVQQKEKERTSEQETTFSHVRRLIEEQEQSRHRKKKKKEKKKKKKLKKKKNLRRSRQSCRSSESSSDSDTAESACYVHKHSFPDRSSNRKRSSTDEHKQNTHQVHHIHHSTATNPSSSQVSSCPSDISPDRNYCKKPRKH